MKTRSWHVKYFLAFIWCVVPSSQVSSAEWIWQADSHQGEVSYFTDNKTAFEMVTEGGWQWIWDEPTAGAVTLLGHSDNRGRGFARSTDFGEALNINEGLTLAARVRPVNAGSSGTLSLSVRNNSTMDLPGGSTRLWVGWNVPNSVEFHDRKGNRLRSFSSSVPWEDRWSIWTLSAIQIGKSVAWDLWIDGAHQAPDQVAADGSLHTLVWTGESDKGTQVFLGQRDRAVYPHHTCWDYLAISNAGVVAGWTGMADGQASSIDADATSLKEKHPDLAARADQHRIRILLSLGMIRCNSFQSCRLQ